jgi:hypothetical protein
MQGERAQLRFRPTLTQSVKRSLKYRLVSEITPTRGVEHTNSGWPRDRPSAGKCFSLRFTQPLSAGPSSVGDADRCSDPALRIGSCYCFRPKSAAVLESGESQLNGRKTGFTGRPTRCDSTPSARARE